MKSQFKAKLCLPAEISGRDTPWTFVVLPKCESDKLPRRGRTTVEGRLNGISFQATLEPDGQLSHWMRVEKALSDAAGAAIGDLVTLEISPLQAEPDPAVPFDLAAALAKTPAARAAWDETTTIARLDWIHWMTTAKQSTTRAKRIATACDMLVSGKRRVCCFDPSGFYSKAFAAPKEAQ